MNLTKIERAQIEVMRQEITPWGLGSAVEMGGKHVVMKVWGRDGSQYRLVIACTPRSDGNSLKAARGSARRLVRLINGRAGY